MIRVGIGGWTYKPWRGVFYPEGLAQKRELEFASRALSSIEINGTYYSSFKPDTWKKWRDQTPQDFVFSIKAPRYCTNRRVLAEAGEPIKRFFSQGLAELGDKLGPINWQFTSSKQFDAAEFGRFLELLPRKLDGRRLRHALDVQHESFRDPRFFELAREAGAAITFNHSNDHPEIDEATTDFVYARLKKTREDVETGYDAAELDTWAKRVKRWTRRGDAFVYFISGAKLRAPAAAQALIARL